MYENILKNNEGIASRLIKKKTNNILGFPNSICLIYYGEFSI